MLRVNAPWNFLALAQSVPTLKELIPFLNPNSIVIIGLSMVGLYKVPMTKTLSVCNGELLLVDLVR